MADILTNGRVIFGVGRGYHTREVETFHAPMLDGEANRELFEEEQLRTLAHPTPDTMALLPQVEDSVRQRNWLGGTPDEAINLFQELEAKYPAVERVIVSFAMGTPQAVCQEQLTRCAEEVMPTFSRRTN